MWAFKAHRIKKICQDLDGAGCIKLGLASESYLPKMHRYVFRAAVFNVSTETASWGKILMR